MELTTYFVITAGYSNLMAVFDSDGWLVRWTGNISEASCFLHHCDAARAIVAICSPEIARAASAGKVVREVDRELGETVVMDYRGRYPRPMRTPGIRFAEGPRTIDDDPEPGRDSIRDFVRAEFASRRQNPTRQHEARIGPQSGTEYATPTSRRGRLAGMAGAYRSA